jgi:hypothetical protein
MKTKKSDRKSFSRGGLCPRKAIPADVLKTLESKLDLADEERFRTITNIEIIDVLEAFGKNIHALNQSVHYIVNKSGTDPWTAATSTRVDAFEPHYTSAEVCNILRITDRTLRNYMKKGWITPLVTPTHKLLFPRSTIQKFLKPPRHRRKK